MHGEPTKATGITEPHTVVNKGPDDILVLGHTFVDC